MNVIEVNGLKKSYGKARGIDDVSFTVGEGEIVGFVGQNGAGKSTTIKLLLNLIFPTAGSAKILGRDCVTQSKEVKRQVSYVPSEVSFTKGQRVGEIIKTTAEFNGIVYDKKQAEEMCRFLELDLNRKVEQLSLGNRKKVSIVQALIKQPRLLILDEPTSGLDPVIQQRLFDIFEAKRREGLSIFLSSHNLSEVNRYCDRIIVVKDGRIMDTLLKDEKRSGYLVRYALKDGQQREEKLDKSAAEVIAYLANLDVESVEVRPLSIENDFMKYYN